MKQQKQQYKALREHIDFSLGVLDLFKDSIRRHKEQPALEYNDYCHMCNSLGYLSCQGHTYDPIRDGSDLPYAVQALSEPEPEMQTVQGYYIDGYCGLCSGACKGHVEGDWDE